MKNTWWISDPHFNHEKIWSIRGFSSLQEHDEALESNWNSVVKEDDLCYCLGDVMLNVIDYTILGRLNGRKKLILGNHDTQVKIENYKPYFESILGYQTIGKGIIVSHIPVHPRELKERFQFNIHGHLHTEIVKDIFDESKPDLRYINVSAEQINLTPVSHDIIQEEMFRRKKILEELYGSKDR